MNGVTQTELLTLWKNWPNWHKQIVSSIFKVNKIMAKKTVADIDVKGKRVLMRCDFNVPLDK
ncbi:MAG: phosphoglycerate kinase, partial [Sedimentisphaerales bacterium]|nr:phosphoglycerate kinase [Sedimentisphaerales bacterium]